MDKESTEDKLVIQEYMK